jgi:hypothetical protein
MPYTAAELANINNSALDFYLEKGKLTAQNVQEKPMAAAFDSAAGTFSGGKGEVSVGVKTGQGGGTIAGYQGDDQVTYYNPTPAKRAAYPWKEHFIGIGFTHSELKVDGITVTENDASQSTSPKEGREQHVLAEILEEKYEAFDEDYKVSWDGLIHGDGTTDTKSLAGVQAFILADPSLGSTGGISRTANTWWRNRAATAAANSAGSGFNAISSASTGGGVLLTFLQKERRQLKRYAAGSPLRHKCFAGSDFIAAMEAEIRANGNYSMTGFRDKATNDGSQGTEEGVPFGSWNFVYDPTLDDLSLPKRAYIIDMASIKLMYMRGEKKKRSNPARPHDRFVMYQGVTTTAVMCAKRLRTSGVYDIA